MLKKMVKDKHLEDKHLEVRIANAEGRPCRATPVPKGDGLKQQKDSKPWVARERSPRNRAWNTQ